MADCADTEPNYGLPATMAGKPFSHYVCGTLDSTGCHPCGCLRPEAAMPEEPTMPITVEVLEAEILNLPARERALLFERLIASLDTDAEVEQAWSQEADRREAEIEAGAVQAIPGDEVIARLRARVR